MREVQPRLEGSVLQGIFKALEARTWATLPFGWGTTVKPLLATTEKEPPQKSHFFSTSRSRKRHLRPDPVLTRNGHTCAIDESLSIGAGHTTASLVPKLARGAPGHAIWRSLRYRPGLHSSALSLSKKNPTRYFAHFYPLPRAYVEKVPDWHRLNCDRLQSQSPLCRCISCEHSLEPFRFPLESIRTVSRAPSEQLGLPAPHTSFLDIDKTDPLTDSLESRTPRSSAPCLNATRSCLKPLKTQGQVGHDWQLLSIRNNMSIGQSH